MWSLASNLVTKEQLEAANLSLDAGIDDVWFLSVNNTHDFRIQNVTLVVVGQGAPIAYDLSETYAGDPPQRHYAFWHNVSAKSGKTVLLHLKVPSDASGNFVLDFVVLFEDPDGTKYVSITATKGTIDKGGGPAFSTATRLWTGWVLGVVAVLGIVALLVLKRRR